MSKFNESVGESVKWFVGGSKLYFKGGDMYDNTSDLFV